MKKECSRLGVYHYFFHDGGLYYVEASLLFALQINGLVSI